MVKELLYKGKENAQSGRDLAKLLHCDIRTITEQVQRERLNGAPICAVTQGRPGYYLAETPEELKKYCSDIQQRESELHKVRVHLLKAAETPETFTEAA